MVGGVQHIVDTFSFPDSHHFWNKSFVVLKWEDGDWGDFLRKDFSCLSDSDQFLHIISHWEMINRDRLIEDNGRNHYR